MNKEAQLGLFVIIVLLVFLFFTVNMGSHFFDQGDRTFNFYFENIGTLETGSPVKQMGLDVGEVSGLSAVTIADPEPKNYIVVEIKVNEQAKIAIDSKGYLGTLGMMGEKYLDVSYGQASPATSDDRLMGVSPYDIDSVIQNTAELSNKLLETVDSLNSVFANPEFSENIKVLLANLTLISSNVNDFVGSATASLNMTMDNLTAASADLRSLLATTTLMIQKNEKHIDITLENTAVISSDIRNDVVPDVKTFMKDIHGFSTKLEDSMQRANQMIAKMDALVDNNQNNVEQAITNIKDLTVNAKQASHRLNDMLNQNEGLVHDLFYDPEFSQSTKATITQASNTLSTFNTISDNITFETELRYFSDDNRFTSKDSNFRGDFGVQYDFAEDWYLFAGGNDLGVTNEFEAQLGYRIGQFAIHGGMIESEVGAGIDWYPFDRLTLGVEGVGLTENGKERLDVYSRYRVWEQVYLTGGAQDVTDQVYPNAGVLFRF